MTSCLFIVYRSSDGVPPLGGGNDGVPPAAPVVPPGVPPAAADVPRGVPCAVRRPACGIFRPQGVTFRSRGQALKECAAHGKQQY